MNLLPREHQEFRQKEYWDTFFRKRGKAAFEWYGEYHELCGILHKYIKPADPVLQVGCGNSTLAADLYDVGYRSIKSIDVSDVVIRQMTNQNKGRPDLVFEKMDATQMTYKENSFNVVLDKGTLDALFTDENEETTEKIDKMFSEIARVLRLGGRYICVSLLQPHIIRFVADWFVSAGWPIRILRCVEADQSKPPQERIFPVFVIVCTKFKKMADMKPVIELGLTSEGQLMRLQKAESLVESVRGCQQFAALRARLAKGGDQSIEEACLQLHAEDSQSVKYSIFLTERKQISSLLFAAFIVPQGREVEWMFATAEGRRQLCDSANCKRLVVVHLGRDSTFKSIEEIQNELSSHILDFSPPDLPPGYKVPFLSAGGENVGSRTERCRGRSQISGDYVVEDVQVGASFYRRLIFLSRPNLTQSEAVLVSKKDKNKKDKKVVDVTDLVSTYHTLMIGSLGLFLSRPVTVLVVGLGGGSLPSYIHRTFPLSNIHVVELDPSMLDIASQQFGFKTDSRVTVTIKDGVDFFKDTDNKFSVIMLDVDSKDISSGLSCPPPVFISPTCLKGIAACLEPDGMFVLNLVCRDTVLRAQLVQDLAQVWDSVCSCKLEEEVNEIIFATSNPALAKDQIKKSLAGGFKLVNEHVKKAVKTKDDLIDLETTIKRLGL